MAGYGQTGSLGRVITGPFIVEESPYSPPELPPWVPPEQQPQSSRFDINDTGTPQGPRFASVSPEGTVVPIIYGLEYIGPIISLATARGNNLYLRCVWCLGEVDAIEAVTLQDGTAVPGVTMTHYTGTATQGVDATLASVLPGYADTCVVRIGAQAVGVAYSVIVVPADSTQGFPRFVARIRGRKVRDPRAVHSALVSNVDSGVSSFADARQATAFNGTEHAHTRSPLTKATMSGSLAAAASAVGTLTLAIQAITWSAGQTHKVVEIGARFSAFIDTDGKFRVKGWNSSGTLVLDFKTAAAITGGTDALAIVMSWDLTTGTVRCRVNGASSLSASPTATAGQTVDLTAANVAIAGEYTGTSNGLFATIAALGLGTVFYDLDDASVRSTVMDSAGRIRTPSFAGGVLQRLWFADGYADSYIDYSTDPVAYSSFTYASAPTVVSYPGEVFIQAGTASRTKYFREAYNGGLYCYNAAADASFYLLLNASSPMVSNAYVPLKMWARVDVIDGGVLIDGSAQEFMRLTTRVSDGVVAFQLPAGSTSVNIKTDTSVAPVYAASWVLRGIHIYPSTWSLDTRFVGVAPDLLSASAGTWDLAAGTASEIAGGGLLGSAGARVDSVIPLWLNGESVTYSFTLLGTFTGSFRIKSLGGQVIRTVTAAGTYTGTFTATDATKLQLDWTLVTAGTPALDRLILSRTGPELQYSKTPALILADLIESTSYGLGASVEDSSLCMVASYNEDVLPDTTEQRVQIGLTLADRSPIQSWLETVRAYARCFIVPRGSQYAFVADRATTPVGDLGASDIIRGTFKPTKRSIINLPNVVKVYFTDTSVTPWNEDFVEAVSANVVNGAEFRRETQLRMPGFQSRSMAYRFAVERLNDSTLIDLRASFTSLDSAFKFEIGDVVRVTHPIGLTSKQMRVIGCDSSERGKMAVSTVEYNAAVYSNEIVEASAPPDSGSSNPFVVPAVVSVALAESFYTSALSTRTQLIATWPAVSYPFLQHYLVQIYENGVKVLTIRTPDMSYSIRDIAIGTLYTFVVAAVSTAFVVGTSASASHVGIGDAAPPDFTTGAITAFEAGDGIVGRVTSPAIDTDLWGYEWRYRPVWRDNIWQKNGITFASGEWTDGYAGSVARWQFNYRSLNYNGGAFRGNTSIGGQLNGTGGLVDGVRYDVYVKIKRINIPDAQTTCSITLTSANSVTQPHAVRMLTQNSRPGVVVFKDYLIEESVFPTAKYISILIANGLSTNDTTLEIEWIAIRQSAGYTDQLSDWNSATLVDRSPALNVRIPQLATDGYMVYARALDSQRSAANPYGQYSVVRSAFATVLSDSSKFIRLRLPIAVTGALTNYGFVPVPMVNECVYQDAGGTWRQSGLLVPLTSGRTWNTAFASNVGSYTTECVFNRFESSTDAKSFSTDTIDLGIVLSGRVVLFWDNFEPSDGTEPTYTLNYSSDGIAWLSATMAGLAEGIDFTGRYLYVSIAAAAGTKREFVLDSGNVIEAQLAARTENGTVSTLAADGSGNPQPVTVALANNYGRVVGLRAWTTTTADGVTVFADNITLGTGINTFTLVALNLRGEPVAVTAYWEFTGI